MLVLRKEKATAYPYNVNANGTADPFSVLPTQRYIQAMADPHSNTNDSFIQWQSHTMTDPPNAYLHSGRATQHQNHI